MRPHPFARKLVAIIGFAALLPPASLHAEAPLPERGAAAATESLQANDVSVTVAALSAEVTRIDASSAFQTPLDARFFVEDPSARIVAKESLLSESAFRDDSSNPSIAAVAIAAAMLGMVAVAVGTAVMQAEVLTD